ncbi:hypothetical protein [Streptomyces tremellae]|uniref:Lipoprotein n=1 Tax=Streptomyces tremellae TaxID=1124239 RepID=A0ABP7FUM2_9ACTN
MVHNSKGRRAAALAISGVAAVGVLAGCGPGGDASGAAAASSPGPSGSASGSAGGGGGTDAGGQGSAAVRAAYRKTVDAKSARLTMSTTVGGVSGNGSLALRGSGVIDLARGASDVVMHLGSQQIEERTLDGMLYEKLPSSTSKRLLPGGKSWLKIDMGEVSSSFGGGSASSAQLTDPAAPFSYVKNLSGKDVTKVGTESVGGTRTTHYRVAVDVGRLAPGDSSRARQLRQQLGNTLPVDLWLDGRGRIRQEEVKASVKTPASASPSTSAPSGAGRLALDSKLRFSDFGATADVTAPPADQTADVTGKIQQGATASPGGS